MCALKVEGFCRSGSANSGFTVDPKFPQPAIRFGPDPDLYSLNTIFQCPKLINFGPRSSPGKIYIFKNMNFVLRNTDIKIRIRVLSILKVIIRIRSFFPRLKYSS